MFNVGSTVIPCKSGGVALQGKCIMKIAKSHKFLTNGNSVKITTFSDKTF